MFDYWWIDVSDELLFYLINFYYRLIRRLYRIDYDLSMNFAAQFNL